MDQYLHPISNSRRRAATISLQHDDRRWSDSSRSAPSWAFRIRDRFRPRTLGLSIVDKSSGPLYLWRTIARLWAKAASCEASVAVPEHRRDDRCKSFSSTSRHRAHRVSLVSRHFQSESLTAAPLRIRLPQVMDGVALLRGCIAFVPSSLFYSINLYETGPYDLNGDFGAA